MYMAAERIGRQSHGFTLIELIMFILVVGVGLAGLLSVFNYAISRSADPAVRKQMLAIAESLLEEVEMQPFTYCDPTDANVTTAASTAGCATTVEALGPETGETRNSTTTPFNNVNDYYTLGGLSVSNDISQTYNFPAGYSAVINIIPENLSTITSNSTPATMEAIRISVTVTHGSDSLKLDGYRARHSPNSP